MSHTHKERRSFYLVYIYSSIVGFITGGSELGAMQNVTKLFGFETTENFIECYPGHFDIESQYVDTDGDWIYDRIDDSNMTFDYFLQLPRVEQIKITYFSFARIGGWNTVGYHMNFICNIAKAQMPMVYPMVEDMLLVANYTREPNEHLWFCRDWIESI